MAIFKGLASITAWILFIGGCFNTLMPTIGYFAEIRTGPPHPEMLASWALGIASFLAAVVVMRMRQKMDKG